MLPVPFSSRHYKGCVRIGLADCKQTKDAILLARNNGLIGNFARVYNNLGNTKDNARTKIRKGYHRDQNCVFRFLLPLFICFEFALIFYRWSQHLALS